MAGPLDFTGQNIEDTYQRVVQTDGIRFYNGTGSAITLADPQNLQQVTDRGSVTTTPITASIISASKIDSLINIVGETGLGSPPPGAHELIFAEAGFGGGFLRLKTDTNPSAGQRLAYTPSIGELNTTILKTTQISLEGVNVFERNLTDKNNFIGNTIDNKTIVRSPMFEITDLYTTGSITASGDISSSNKIKAKDYLIEGNTLADMVTAFGVGGTIGIGDTSKPLAIVGSNIGVVAPFSASIISASNTIHAKSLRLPQGIVPSEGAIYFGSSPADNNGVIYDDSTALVLGYNDSDKVRIADTNPQVTITGNLKIFSTAGGHITASGGISASGTITADSFVGIIDGGTF